MGTQGPELRYRFAFDIGGTFTDLVLSASDGSVMTGKVLSNHDDVVGPIVSGLMGILLKHGIQPRQVEQVVVGATTLVTNLIIERKGALTGLITTQGFRDVIEIARELRYDVYDLNAEFPDPIVPRELRRELPERIDCNGAVLRSPGDEEIEEVVLRLRRDGVQAIAVCLLHSYRNPLHEVRVRDVAKTIAPEIAISLSSEVNAEMREYERTTATVLNAYAMPTIETYLTRIESALKASGVDATLQIMQSNGGIISREFGERMPIRVLESGPAAGALGAAHAAWRCKLSNIVAFDMGGTTAKACLISNGRPLITTDFEAARVHRFKKGSGLPVRLPIVDLIEIGAGGGSIATVDNTGLLKVGPRSAGSNPGPACYGLGGSEPTVTDAALLLGYLDPLGSLSDVVKMHPDLAEQAIKLRIADPLGLTVIEAASGIYRIVCENMASAAKIHAVEKGHDIRRFTLLSFGGAGPMHAREVARRSGCTEVMIPANAGVFSAIGLLVAPMKVDIVRSRFSTLSNVDWGAIEDLYAELAQCLSSELVAAGVDHNRIEFRRTADMRYVGQGFEVNTAVPTALSRDSRDDVAACFNEAYEAQYGHRLSKQAIEVLNWRLEASARVEWPELLTVPEAQPERGTSRSRLAFFPDLGSFINTPVLADAELVNGTVGEGPSLIEQAGSTVVIGPGDRYAKDGIGNIHITLAPRSTRSSGSAKPSCDAVPRVLEGHGTIR
ncbi:MAG: hydantoinase/oxoprolinase family protein [Nitrospiraceae bacterium]